MSLVVGVRLLVGLALASAPGVAHAQSGPTKRFDGSWQMLFVCDTAPDGARGYTKSMVATVAGGQFLSAWGVRGEPDSMMFQGSIASDGSVVLTATGLTGNTLYSFGRVAAGSAVKFHMVGHFESDHGEGHRLESRPCTMDLSRR